MTQLYWQPPANAPKRLTTPVAILIAVLGGVLLVCGIGSCTALLAPAEPAPTVTVTQSIKPSPSVSSPVPQSPAPTPSRSPSATPDEPVAEPVAAAPEIQGTDLVLVGEDVPAGTYRVVERVTADPWCYWAKYRDSEGEDILANDIVRAGRPQVTLKKGQWFKSSGCPAWRKK